MKIIKILDNERGKQLKKIVEASLRNTVVTYCAGSSLYAVDFCLIS